MVQSATLGGETRRIPILSPSFLFPPPPLLAPQCGARMGLSQAFVDGKAKGVKLSLVLQSLLMQQLAQAGFP